MSDSNSPWGSGGSSGGSGGNSNGGGNRGNSPWGSGGGRSGRPTGNRGSGNGGGNRPQSTELDNVIRGFKSTFGGGGNGPVKRGGGKPGLNMPFAIIGVGIVMMLLSSVYTIKQQERGVVLRFGKYARTADSGIHFKLPSPFENVIKKNTTTERSVGSQNNLVLTSDENIALIDFTVLWKINNIEDYLFKLENPDEVVSDAADSALREIVGKNELGPLITDQRANIEFQVESLLQEMLDVYGAGVQVTNVQLQRAEAPPKVLPSFDDVVKAEQELEQRVNEGIAHRNDVTERAVGEAAKIVESAEAYKREVVVVAEGETDRFLAVLNVYKSAPVVTRQRLYLEAMEVVYKDANKLVLDDNAAKSVVPYLPLDQIGKKSAPGRGQ